MDRAAEAKLAFVGGGETSREPLKSADFADDRHISSLIADKFVAVESGVLICTVRGWRHLDSRPIDGYRIEPLA